jgi:hypothetical protein
MKYEHKLLNEIANNILGQVKPVKLRKEIIGKILGLIENTVKHETQKLEQELSGYITDQEIWLTRNDSLEKENAELKAQLAELCVDATSDKLVNKDALIKDLQSEVDRLTKDNEERCDEYQRGYRAGYEYGKQDAITADRAEPDTEPEHCECKCNCERDPEVAELISENARLNLQLHYQIGETALAEKRLNTLRQILNGETAAIVKDIFTKLLSDEVVEKELYDDGEQSCVYEYVDVEDIKFLAERYGFEVK